MNILNVEHQIPLFLMMPSMFMEIITEQDMTYVILYCQFKIIYMQYLGAMAWG